MRAYYLRKYGIWIQTITIGQPAQFYQDLYTSWAKITNIYLNSGIRVNYNISPPPFWKFLLLLFIWFLQCCICRCYKLCRAIWYTAQMPHHKSWYCAPKLSKGNIDRRQSNSPIGKNVTGQKWSVFLGSRVIYRQKYKRVPKKSWPKRPFQT